MEFNLLNIEETLEKSRKVLMNSLEVVNSSGRYPLLDRTDEIKSKDNEEPEYYRMYLDKMMYLNAKDHERKIETEKIPTNESPSFQEIESKNQIIKKLKLEIEKNQIHQENEELRKKITNFQKENPNETRIKKVIFDVKQEKNRLEEKYKSEYEAINQLEILEIKNQVKEQQNISHNKFQELTRKLEKLLKENSELNQLITPQQPSESTIEKYKNLIKSLKKKLKTVTKKYSKLIKKDPNTSQRYQSACKRQKNKTSKDKLKTLHSRIKSTERNATPKRN